MHIGYMDDSGNGVIKGLVVLLVPEDSWHLCFDQLAEHRSYLKKTFGIPQSIELHATDLLGGRGKHLSQLRLGIRDRVRAFTDTLECIAALPGIRMIHGVADEKSLEPRLFEWILNRIQAEMKSRDSRAVLFCDQGNETRLRAVRRKMGRLNHIPSKGGGIWLDTGAETKNIVIDRIFEDPLFVDSRTSPFVQAADFCAHALVAQEMPKSAHIGLGLNRAFRILDPIMAKESSSDPQGMIRVWKGKAPKNFGAR